MLDHLRVRPPRRPDAIAEVECPSCGAPRANDNVVWIDPATGKTSTEHGALDPAVSTAVFLTATAVTGWTAVAFVPALPAWGALAVGAVLGLSVLFAISARAVKRGASQTRAHLYKCVVCDHEWTWREGSPRPRYRYREQIMDEYERLFGSKAGDHEDEL